MSRRTRTAAFLSAAALLTGGVATLGLAPAALADPPAFLPDLTVTPGANNTIVVSGSDCLGVPISSNATAAPAADPNPGDPNAGDPNGGGAGGGNGGGNGNQDPSAGVGSVLVTVDGPGGYHSTASVAQVGTDGSWSSNNDGDLLTLQAAGTYTINATCSLAGSPVGLGYPQASYTVQSTPTVPVDPQITATPGSVTPGSQVSVTGTGFGNASGVTVTLGDLGSKDAAVSFGGWSGVTFDIPASAGSGPLTGTVVSQGASIPNQTFTVTVTAPQQSGTATQDGDVPPAVTGGSSSTTGTSSYGGTVPSYTSSARPTLPQTGSDALWPGVVGGGLLVAGGGLLWLGRRRDEVVGGAAA